jgi:hypothetical protein
VTVTDDDLVVIVGGTQGPVEFGGGERPAFGGDDVFIAAYNSNLNHQWSHVFGSAGDGSS